ncbi:hypothetical protein C0Q70_12186 [Pomacea canaliculata]|uniref:Uncharacterized protein n=1 Tax=Pomacea canaliculata TaxID=400727 RepID=A0A2T7P0V6_POMCA|nr:hypothetical protein C0Q70_12186 [Pomacea canaliculata]
MQIFVVVALPVAVNRPKPTDVSCTARADMDADRLSCTITNIYSSRGVYTCQALRRNEETHSEVERLNTVNMASLNDEGGLKVSGECNIRTELPENAGNYSYSVKILPGGLEVLANLLGGEKWIEHYRPKESDISCTAWDECKTNVKLYCTIKIYSSRGVYTCQAFREKLGQNSQEELNTVNMTTTNDEGGRTMTGKCIITTELPEKAGNYSYSVKISPGGSKKEAKLPDGGKWIEHVGTGTAVASQAAIYNVLTVWLVAAFVLL